jgi:hypothetical protein
MIWPECRRMSGRGFILLVSPSIFALLAGLDPSIRNPASDARDGARAGELRVHRLARNAHGRPVLGHARLPLALCRARRRPV